MTAASLKVVYRLPLALAMVILLGLLFALLGDGFWDVVSWLLLAVPLLLLAFFLRRPSPRPGRGEVL